MEMILHTKEFGFWNMLVKERDGTCLKKALFLGFFGMLGVQLKAESISLLVKLKALLWVDLLVIELEYVIFEFGVNVYLSVKINRSLHSTQTFAWMSIVKVSSVLILRCPIKALEEADTWSLGSWVLDGFRIIILEVMLMLMLTVRCTEKWLAYIA